MVRARWKSPMVSAPKPSSACTPRSYASTAAREAAVTGNPYASASSGMPVILANQLAMQEGEGAALGPRVVAPRALEEPRVAALGHEHALDPGRLRHLRLRKRGRRHEGIVDGIDEQRRAADLREIRPAARLRPVVVLVGEAEDRRGDEAIVFRERPRSPDGREVDPAVVEMRLGPDLRLHRAQEAPRVERAAQPEIEDGRTCGQVERGRDGDGRSHLLERCLAALAEPLERDVAAEGHADQADVRGRLALEEAMQHPVQVRGLPRVIEPRPAVQLAAARAEMHHDGLQAEGPRLAAEAAHVVRARGALEAVQHEHERRARTRGLAPVEVEEIAVSGLDALAPEPRSAEGAEER